MLILNRFVGADIDADRQELDRLPRHGLDQLILFRDRRPAHGTLRFEEVQHDDFAFEVAQSIDVAVGKGARRKIARLTLIRRPLPRPCPPQRSPKETTIPQQLVHDVASENRLHG